MNGRTNWTLLALLTVASGALLLQVAVALGGPVPRTPFATLALLLALGSLAPAAAWRHWAPWRAEAVWRGTTAGVAVLFVLLLATGHFAVAATALLCASANLFGPLLRPLSTPSAR